MNNINSTYDNSLAQDRSERKRVVFLSALATVAILLALVLAPAPLSHAVDNDSEGSDASSAKVLDAPLNPLAAVECDGLTATVADAGDAVCSSGGAGAGAGAGWGSSVAINNLRITGAATITGEISPGANLEINIDTSEVVTFSSVIANGTIGSQGAYINLISPQITLNFIGDNVFYSWWGGGAISRCNNYPADSLLTLTGDGTLESEEIVANNIVNGISLIGPEVLIGASGNFTNTGIIQGDRVSVGGDVINNGEMTLSDTYAPLETDGGNITNTGTITSQGPISTHGGNVTNSGTIEGDIVTYYSLDVGGYVDNTGGTINGDVDTHGGAFDGNLPSGELNTEDPQAWFRDKTPASAPTLTWQWSDTDSVRINWTRPTDLGDPTANYYYVEVREDSNPYPPKCVDDIPLAGYFFTTKLSLLCDGLEDGKAYTAFVEADFVASDAEQTGHILEGNAAVIHFTFTSGNTDNHDVDPCEVVEPTAQQQEDCAAFDEPDPNLTDPDEPQLTPEEECVNDGGTWETDHCVPPAPATTPCPTGTTGTSVEADDCVPNAATTPTSHGDVPLSDALKALGAYIDENGTIHVPTGEAIPLTVIHDTEGDITTEFTFVSTSSVEYTAYDIIDNDAKTITFTHASPHSVAGTAANRADVAFVFEVFDSPKLGQTGVSNTTILNYALLLLIAGLGVSFTRRKFGA